MSFSAQIKEELSRQKPGARHCRIAELAAIISLGGASHTEEGLILQTENLPAARKYFTLLKKTFNIVVEFSIRYNYGRRKSLTYTVRVRDAGEADMVMQAVRLQEAAGWTPDGVVILQSCCKRAFLRGAFLVTGSLSDPQKFYHLEFACGTEQGARQIQSVLKAFELEARLIRRKKYHVVYLKEGDQIVDALNVMEAHLALMELENIRILKDMRNTVNRKVNCETANIHKTVNAAVKQIEDIKYIRDTTGFSGLSENLAEMARIRLAHPDATLKELGMLLTPQVGKSGVNHRLRKLGGIADRLRDQQGGETL